VSGKKSLNRVVFLAVAAIIIFGASAYLVNKNKTNETTAKQANVNTSNPSGDTNVFQKPGAPAQNYTPVEQTKTTAQLEEVVQSKASTPADYNTLAMSYYKNGDKGKALQTINDGLVKFPNDKSLLLTKDDIENILPNL
jgi:TolA-binding protein